MTARGEKDWPGTLARLVSIADVSSGTFAFVMATGIVSIAAALNGIGPVATALFFINLIAFSAIWLLLFLRVCYHPSGVLAELQDHRSAPSVLTIVAGTCLFGDQVSLLTAHHKIAAALWAGAAVLWSGLTYCPFALTIKPTKPLLDDGLDGSWLLIVVAPQALAISALQSATSMPSPEPVLFASLCLFGLGSAFYLIVLMLIVYRWLFWPMRRDQFASSYWINMGAAAITVLAGARLLPLVGADPNLVLARGFVAGETVMFWSLATWWIPLLCGLTLWRWRAGAAPIGYRLANWSIVFPLGMYTAASWHFSRVMGLPFLAMVPRVFIWVAILAWCLAFAGMFRRNGGRHRKHEHTVAMRPEGPTGSA
jgi:tellurite resistance protein TehA-like permease